MDSILLLGNTDTKLSLLLQRMGYRVFENVDAEEIGKIMREFGVNLIMIDSRSEFDPIELIALLREDPNTRWVALMLICKEESLRARVEAAGYTRIDYIDANYNAPHMVSKVATTLRLRKLVGADDQNQPTLAEVNASLREMNSRFAKELEEARQIQETLLPAALPSDPKVQFAACYLPLDEVGGDWYHVSRWKDGRIIAQIADVTGHGLAAALIGSMTKLALAASQHDSPDKILTSMNSLMTPQMPEGKFVTIATYLYDAASGKLDFARGGHPPAIWVDRKNNNASELKTNGMAIGFIEDGSYGVDSLTLGLEDLFVMYSDAITESQNKKGELYGTQRLMESLLAAPPTLSAEQVMDFALSRFKDFCEGRPLKDDVTMIVLKRVA